MSEMKNAPGIRQTSEVIDLVDLFFCLLGKWHYLVLFTLIGALVMNAYTFFFVKPTYESTSKLYVVSASGDSVVDLTDLNIGTNLTNDYKELIMSYPVLNRVIQALNLDMDDEGLKKLVTISNPSNTRVITITVKTSDAKLSMDIANTMAGVVQEYLPETMSTVKPNVAQVARMAKQKSGPSYSKNTVMGALLGFMLMAGFLVVRYLMDDTIHTGEDLEKAFGIKPLAVIPENKEMLMNDEQMISFSSRRDQNHASRIRRAKK